MRLLRIELIKIINNNAFWVLFGLYIVLFVPIAFGLDSLFNSFTVNINGEDQAVTEMLQQGFSIFSYPDIWHYMAYLASWFKLLLAVLIVITVTNEYGSRTLRQNIIDGLSKWEVIIAKELFIILLSIVALIILVVTTLFLGEAHGSTSILEGSEVLIPYFISLLLYLNLAYFLSSWLKKAGITLGILFLYSLIIENIISWKIPDSISNYFPVNLIDNMIPNPASKFLGNDISPNFGTISIAVAVSYITIFIIGNYFMLTRGHAAKQ